MHAKRISSFVTAPLDKALDALLPSLPPDHASNMGTVAGLFGRSAAGQMFTRILLKVARSPDPPRHAAALRSYLQAMTDPAQRSRLMMQGLEALLAAPRQLPQGSASDDTHAYFVRNARKCAVGVAMVLLEGPLGFKALDPEQQAHVRQRLLEEAPDAGYASRILQRLGSDRP